ncbi:MAG TPA: hypothetical protein DCL73_01795 [Treponema sp.]|nr:hypothetical protein [Treponema sp.]
MGKKRLAAIVPVLLLTASCCWSAQLSFQVVQHNNTQEKVCEQTFVIEDEMLDYFFSRGNIVTNEPAVAVKEGSDEAVWKAAFADAAAGGSQYFVQLRLYYDTTASTNPEAVALSNLDYAAWTITDVQSGQILADVKSVVDKTSLGKDDTDSVRGYAVKIAEQIQKSLKVKA